MRDIAGGDNETYWRHGAASGRQAELIVTKQITGVNLARQIRQFFRHSVGNAHNRLLMHFMKGARRHSYHDLQTY